jgi:hypothetical protein
LARLVWSAALLLAGMAVMPAEAARKRPAPAAAPAVPVAPSVRAGVDLWRAGDYSAAVAMWQPFANAGDADAMFNIGQAYKLGRAVAKDQVAARDWYRRAAQKGHLPAQANLGILLFQAGDKAEAIRWLKAAADKNEMRAQYVLGVASWNGDGTPRSLTLAYAYLSRAAAQGLAEATTALNNLTGVIAPVERANGWAVATSLAAGNGVPPEFAPGGAAVSTAALDRFNRDQVIKALPKPAAAAPTPAPTPVPTQTASISPPPIAASQPASAPPLPPKPVVTTTAPVVPPPVAASKAVAVTAAAPSSAAKPAVTPTPQPAPKPVAVATAAPAPAPKPIAVATSAPAPKPITVAAATPQPAPSLERPAAPPVKTVAIPAAAPTVAPPRAEPRPVQVATAVAPKPKPEPKPEAKPTAWRVQLGAFAKRAQAEAAWTEVKTKQKQLVANTKPIYEPAGSVTKLQLGPYPSKTAARDACAKIAFSGRACFVTEG